jgi:hypothetical protein
VGGWRGWAGGWRRARDRVWVPGVTSLWLVEGEPSSPHEDHLKRPPLVRAQDL